MVPALALVGVSWLFVLAAGCSGPPPAEAPTQAATAVPSAPLPTASASEKPAREPPQHAAPVTTFGDPVPAAAGDYEITVNDCTKLWTNYERRYREVEEAKLAAQKLQGKYLEKAKVTVDEAVKQAVDNWRGQCQSIIGTVQIRTRIRCAVEAETLDRFNGCWDGKFDHEQAGGAPPGAGAAAPDAGR